jgi:hypothetical protein
VLLNSGDGAFQAKLDITAGRAPNGVAVDDLKIWNYAKTNFRVGALR